MGKLVFGDERDNPRDKKNLARQPAPRHCEADCITDIERKGHCSKTVAHVF
jgi:hypothetical protein